jgi:AcrR family transcriptional regulator
MPLDRDDERSGRGTRRRILEAATLRFSRHSYEETKLRDIAADVGVDVALVHRSFGSKEQLFAEVMKAAFQLKEVLEVKPENLGAYLTERLLESSGREPLEVGGRSVNPLDIVIRSLASPQALPIVREFTLKEFLEPLTTKLGDPSSHRAVLIAAMLLGIKIFREMIVVEALQESTESEWEPLLGNILGLAIGEPDPADSPPGL